MLREASKFGRFLFTDSKMPLKLRHQWRETWSFSTSVFPDSDSTCTAHLRCLHLSLNSCLELVQLPVSHNTILILLKLQEASRLNLSSNMQMHFAFESHIYSSSSMTTYVFPIYQTLFLFLIYANDFWTCTHMYIYIQNTTGHEVLSDSHKYFTFVSYIYSFTSMIF